MQANNVYIFPGGWLWSGHGGKAKTVTDDMFLAAARALADYVDKGPHHERHSLPRAGGSARDFSRGISSFSPHSNSLMEGEGGRERL